MTIIWNSNHIYIYYETYASDSFVLHWLYHVSFRWLKEYIHNPSYYHHQIGSIHLSHCCHIFPWLCVWDGCTIIFCHLLHIYPGNTGTLFHYWCSVYGICKWSDTLWPAGRVRLFADYTISLSSLCRLIWKHWTTKMLVRYMMPSVCLRLRQFSQLSLYSLYGAVCLQLTQFSCDDRENVYFILLSSSNRKYESLTIV